jgi:hypothetical protein
MIHIHTDPDPNKQVQESGLLLYNQVIESFVNWFVVQASRLLLENQTISHKIGLLYIVKIPRKPTHLFLSRIAIRIPVLIAWGGVSHSGVGK